MKILLFALILFVAKNVSALEIETSFISQYAFEKNGLEPTFFDLNGDIERGDLEKIQRFLKSRQGKDTRFSINSRGGYVNEAIDIGLFFRDIFMEVDVKDQCDSACFYILVGAYKRSTFVPLGLHRPYFEASKYASLSSLESEAAFSNVINLVRNYLEKVHVSPLVVDEMMKASPREMMYVQPNDFKQLIGYYSPVKQDWLTAKCDTRSPEELEKWRLIVEMNYYESTLKDYAQIYQSPMGLFEAVQKLNKQYKETIEAHKTVMNISPTDKAILNKKLLAVNECKSETKKKEREQILGNLTV